MNQSPSCTRVTNAEEFFNSLTSDAARKLGRTLLRFANTCGQKPAGHPHHLRTTDVGYHGLIQVNPTLTAEPSLCDLK